MGSALRGMFAFALWDARNAPAALARDRVGIKPLHLFQDQRRIVFASELKALLAAPFVSRSVDLNALEDYLTFGMVQGQRSILRGVRRLAAGSVAVITQDRLAVNERRYWSLSMRPDARWTDAAATEAIRAKVEETVRAHMVADVPVGAFLSGGMDSGIVVGLAGELSSGPLQTFSIGFHEEAFSELAEARDTARRFGTDHHEEIVTADYSISLVEELTAVLRRAVRRSVGGAHLPGVPPCVARGEGGALRRRRRRAFAGYGEHLSERLLSRRSPLFAFARILASMPPLPIARWNYLRQRAAKIAGDARLPSTFQRFFSKYQLLPRPARAALYRDEFRARLETGDELERLAAAYFPAPVSRDPVENLLYADTIVRLPDDMLTKVDRASMQHSLEVRVPFSRMRRRIRGERADGSEAPRRDGQVPRAEGRRAVAAARHPRPAQAGLRRAARALGEGRPRSLCRGGVARLGRRPGGRARPEAVSVAVRRAPERPCRPLADALRAGDVRAVVAGATEVSGHWPW